MAAIATNGLQYSTMADRTFPVRSFSPRQAVVQRKKKNTQGDEGGGQHFNRSEHLTLISLDIELSVPILVSFSVTKLMVFLISCF